MIIMYSNTYTQIDTKDILPDIVIDDSAEDYVETEDESEDEPEPHKSRPPPQRSSPASIKSR